MAERRPIHYCYPERSSLAVMAVGWYSCAALPCAETFHSAVRDLAGACEAYDLHCDNFLQLPSIVVHSFQPSPWANTRCRSLNRRSSRVRNEVHFHLLRRQSGLWVRCNDLDRQQVLRQTRLCHTAVLLTPLKRMHLEMVSPNL